MKKTILYVIKAHQHDNSLSLEQSFTSGVSGGQCESNVMYSLVTKQALDDLRVNAKRNFNYELYDSYLENEEDEKANQYFEENRLDIPYDEYENLFMFEDKEEMEDFISNELNTEHYEIDC